MYEYSCIIQQMKIFLFLTVFILTSSCSTIDKIRPKTIGQALRIEGITPAAAYILLSHVKRKSIKHIA